MWCGWGFSGEGMNGCCPGHPVGSTPLLLVVHLKNGPRVACDFVQPSWRKENETGGSTSLKHMKSERVQKSSL